MTNLVIKVLDALVTTHLWSEGQKSMGTLLIYTLYICAMDV